MICDVLSIYLVTRSVLSVGFVSYVLLGVIYLQHVHSVTYTLIIQYYCTIMLSANREHLVRPFGGLTADDVTQLNHAGKVNNWSYQG